MSNDSEMDETFKVILELIKNKGYIDSDFKFEQGKRDITVMCDKEIDFIIEMKKSDVNLNMKHVMQAIRYGQKSKTRIVIITNGKDWLFYDSLIEAQINFGAFREEIPKKNDLEDWKKGIIDWSLNWEDHKKINKLKTTRDKVEYLINHPELSPILQTVPKRGSYDWALQLEYINTFCGINISQDIIEKIVRLSQPNTKNDVEHIPPSDTIRRVYYDKFKTDIIPQKISSRNKDIKN